MKNMLLALCLSVSVGTALTLNSCKKTETTPGTSDDSVSAQDVSTVTNATSATSDDATAAAGQVQGYSGKTGGLWVALCGSTTVDTANHQIEINYDGTTDCYGIIRSGSVTITLVNGPWKNAGAALNITYNGLKITDAVSGGSFIINGTQKVTNETGGLAWKIAFGLVSNASVTHRYQATLSITFPNGSQRNWTVDRSTEWASVSANSHNTITASIFTEGQGGVDASGTNRYGNQFTNSILQTIAADNNLGCFYKPYQGKTQHVVSGRSTTVLYGTDESGNQIGSPTVCGLGYYITYTNINNAKTASRFVGYWL